MRWMTRGESQAPMDNGWQILSIADTPEYLAEPGNLVITDFNAVCAIEPALIGIWDFPVSTELMLHVDEQGTRIIDTATNREVTAEHFYVPPQHRT